MAQFCESFTLHLLKACSDDGNPVFDGGDRIRVTDSQDGLTHTSCFVDICSLGLHSAHKVTMCVQQGL